MIYICIGSYSTLLDIRRYIFDLTATLSSAKGSNSEKWRSFPAEIAALKAVFLLGSNEWYYLADPSEFLSFEMVARPRPDKHFEEGKPTKNIGMGNVRMYNAELYYQTILIEAQLDTAMWSKELGAPKYQCSVTLRVHTGRLEIQDQKVNYSLAPRIETCNQLLKVHHASTERERK